jgi:hypothetical protein
MCLREDKIPEYVTKKEYDEKIVELENTLEQKLGKNELPDHNIYALKEDLPIDYLKKEDLPEPIDTSKFVTKEEAYNFATKEDIPVIPDHSIYAIKDELPDFTTFAKKNDLEKLDLSEYAKKTDLPIVDHCFCKVKLEKDFMFYDAVDADHELYMGYRGEWKTQNLYNVKLEKVNNNTFTIWTPFEGIFDIDFSCTVRRDTHFCKPQVTQRIRTAAGELTHFDYFDNKSTQISFRDDVTTRTFCKTGKLWLPKGAWIKFSMQFSNRSHQKRKQWIHCIGSKNYAPTYFCVHGIRTK